MTMIDPLDSLIDANAAALRLQIEPQWKAEVKIQLQVILRLGSLVAEFPLPDDTEPAPVFEA
jgi:hypothetical protein